MDTDLNKATRLTTEQLAELAKRFPPPPWWYESPEDDDLFDLEENNSPRVSEDVE